MTSTSTIKSNDEQKIETIDFGIPKELNSGLERILIPTDRKEEMILKQPLSDDTEQHTEDDNDLLKDYFFGCRFYHPKWLQVFANKKAFTILMCLLVTVQGSVVSGITSVVISTLEKRYSFSSTLAGVLVGMYDLTVVIGIVFITYIGGKLHRPKVMGISAIVLGIGNFVVASPQFLFGNYSSSNTQGVFELCTFEPDYVNSDDCSATDIGAYIILVIGLVLIGLGSTALYTVAVAYIDEIVYPKYVSLHLGAILVFGVIGPAIGYLLGSSLLAVYVDPWVESEITDTNPNWVGAWWIGYTLMGALSFILSVPFLMFPKWLSDSHLVKVERAKEMVKTFSSKFINEDPLTLAVKEFPIHIKSLLTNTSYMFTTFALAMVFVVKDGVVTFGPKYIESMFSLTAYTAGLLAGGLGITAAAFGVASGALIIYFWKPTGRSTTFPHLIILAIALPFVLIFLFKCPSNNVAGITVPYPDGAFNGKDSSICSLNCSCESSVFEPVCGEDGITYFSACRAGCSQRTEPNTNEFLNCTCITYVSNDTQYESRFFNGTSTEGLCPSDCNNLIPFIIIMFFLIFLLLMIEIPYYYYTLRVVADDQRHLALGLQSAIFRTFGSIPGPLLFGAVVDLACVEWEYNCGVRGNCWIYDNDELSLNAILLCLPFFVISVVFLFCAMVTYPRERQISHSPSKSNESISTQGELKT